MKRNFLKMQMGAAFLAMSSGLGAAPNPNEGFLSGADDLKQGTVVTIMGEGFGTRSSDSPVFVDYGEVTYENGEVKNFNQSLEDMSPVPTTVKDNEPNAPWADRSDGNVYIQKQGAMRHRYSSAQYFLDGPWANLRRPTAYGGQDGWSTPLGNPKVYIAWWIKTKYDPNGYYRIAPGTKSGDFIEGEQVVSNTGFNEFAYSGFSGRYIGIDEQGLLNFEFMGIDGIGNLKNAVIEGKQSGASVTFPEDRLTSSNDVGYQPPGSQKFIRVWDESSGKEGIRFSWTNMHQTISDWNKNGASITNWESTHLTPGEWHLFELEMDTAAGTVQTSVDGNKMKIVEFPKDTAATELGSPTIGLIGIDGKQQKFQKARLDDIYMDTQFNRVIIGNAKNLDNVTHYEIQNYSSWSDEKVQFRTNFGSLDTNNELYVFVADPDGNFNEEGFALSHLQEFPPEKTDVDVK